MAYLHLPQGLVENVAHACQCIDCMNCNRACLLKDYIIYSQLALPSGFVSLPASRRTLDLGITEALQQAANFF